jgi:hypothetical protein
LSLVSTAVSLIITISIATTCVAATICVEDFDYYPHYDFQNPPGRGYAAELFELFRITSGIDIRIVPLPVKRLQNTPYCDLIYPDNPQWHLARGSDKNLTFSEQVTGIIGATVVRTGQANLTLSKLKTIAIVRGFTPDHLLTVQPEYKFKLIETKDAAAALMMLLKNRVDAADVEWHVAEYQLAVAGFAGAVKIGQQLPISTVGFHLSSKHNPELIREFNLFLLEHAEKVTMLKSKFNLKTIEQLKQVPDTVAN